MQTYAAKRVDIVIEAVMEKRLAKALIETDVTGFTVLPVLSGSGRSGHWSGEGEVGRASGMVNFSCIVRPERVDPLLEGIFEILHRHIGVVSVVDCEVLRAERF